MRQAMIDEFTARTGPSVLVSQIQAGGPLTAGLAAPPRLPAALCPRYPERTGPTPRLTGHSDRGSL
jgi:hypothetical protein